MSTPQTRAIEIDLQVHRAIEARRTAFTQTDNDILRQVFGIPESSPPPLPPDPAESPRRTGRYAYVLLGDGVEERSLKAAYMSCLRKLADLEPRILERLAGKPTRGTQNRRPKGERPVPQEARVGREICRTAHWAVVGRHQPVLGSSARNVFGLHAKLPG